MSWRTPTEADLLEAISADELQGLRSASLATGQPDPVAAHLATVVDEIRGYIAANRENRLGPVGTLPPRLIRACVDIALLRVGSRVIGMVFDADNVRRDAARAAARLLERVADGRFAIESPDDSAPASEQATGQGPRVAVPIRNFTRETQQGI